MTYQILHRTLYEYAAPVTVSHHVARLEPRPTPAQEREQFTLKIFPEPTLRKSRSDYFDNRLCFFSIQEINSRLEIIAHRRVSVNPPQSIDIEPSTPWTEVAGMFRDPVS